MSMHTGYFYRATAHGLRTRAHTAVAVRTYMIKKQYTLQCVNARHLLHVQRSLRKTFTLISTRQSMLKADVFISFNFK